MICLPCKDPVYILVNFRLHLSNIFTLTMTHNLPTMYELKNVIFEEEEAIEFLFREGILRVPRSCIHCLGALRREGSLWRCTSRECRKTVSIYQDTVLSGVRMGPSKFLFFGYLWLVKDSATSIITKMGLSSATVTNNLEKIRKLVAEKINLSNKKIGGEGIIVEIDESKFGKRKNNRGHHVEGV
jgi:hypothetical protein